MNTLMVYSAQWCGPCKAMKLQMKDLELPVDEILNIDVDECSEEAKSVGIRGVPTLILLENGAEIKRTSGFQGPTKLVEFCTT